MGKELETIKSDPTLSSFESLENTTYAVKTSLKVDEYYKQANLRAIDIKDVNCIKAVSKKPHIWVDILKEFMFGIAMAFLGILLGKMVTGMKWDNAQDICYFFITLLGFFLFFVVYLFIRFKQSFENNKLVDALNEHLFLPLGIKEGDNNEK